MIPIVTGRCARILSLAVLLCGAPASSLAQAAGACQYQLLTTLPVRYTGPGLSLTIEGQINGTAADMLVDTGADFSMLTSAATSRRALQLNASDGLLEGIGGQSKVYTAWIKEFRAGPTVTRNERLGVLNEFGGTPSYDAILGAPFLLQTDLEISLATKEIRFFRPVDCKGASLAYWSQDPIVVPFTASYWRSPNPEFKVLLNGKEVTAVIDTGADTTVITRTAAELAGIKLDAAGVERVADAVGIGKRSVPHWKVTLGTLEIGREKIHHAKVGVIDTEALDVDVLLGADFLRAHRVLFAMSQRKLYFTYVGGEPLGQRNSIEPWMQQEADAGNGDAQLLLASMYARGEGVPADQAKADAWQARAAAGGNPRAGLMLAQASLDKGQHLEATTRLRAILDRRPDERIAALWLFLARMHGGDPTFARSELATTFKSNTHVWPGPVADFYMGKLSAQRLIDRVGADGTLGRRHTCQALDYIAYYYRSTGEKAQPAGLPVRPAWCWAAP